jgi:hypothetical protein
MKMRKYEKDLDKKIGWWSDEFYSKKSKEMKSEKKCMKPHSKLKNLISLAEWKKSANINCWLADSKRYEYNYFISPW